MSAFSNHLEAGILNHTLRGQTLPTPSTVYLALYTSDPTDDATGSEVSDSAYDRQDMAKGDVISSGFTAPVEAGDGTETSNAKSIQFPAIADGSVTISHWGLFDAMTGGNLLYQGSFTQSKTLEINDVMSIDIGSLTITLR